MKRLLLMRHAKSDWNDSSLSDHDRPLNPRGERDAPLMGSELELRRLAPQLIISSTARRARDTADLVARHCGFTGQIVLEADLYHATLVQWEKAMRSLPEHIDDVLMVGHNPGITLFQSLLSGHQEPFPTATIAILQLDADDWQSYREQGLRLLEILRPKEL